MEKLNKKDYLRIKKNFTRSIRRHNKFFLIGINERNKTIALNASIYKFKDRIKLANLKSIYEGQR